MENMFNVTAVGCMELEELTMAFFLCALIGVEREIRQKSAGLRTHTLVGISAALFMLISKYGFVDVIPTGRLAGDPSRLAAQIVSGIGFIGGGVIFTQRNNVRGLTTAASIWFTAAIGMACGAGLFMLSLATMLFYFIIMFVFPILARNLPHHGRVQEELRISYDDGRGLLRSILLRCSELHFAIDHISLNQNKIMASAQEDHADKSGTGKMVTMTMLVVGKRPISDLVGALSAIEGVQEVDVVNDDAE